MIIRKTILSVIEFVPKVITEILHELQKGVPLSEQDMIDLRLILEEAATNAIQHGNQFDTNLKVQLVLEHDKDLITIRVKDQGHGFDYQNLPNIKETNEQMNSFGRGIFLIKKKADEVIFNKTGSEVCIRKTIHRSKN